MSFNKHLFLGFEGFNLDSELEDYLMCFKAESLIVFSRNWDSPEQFKKLLNSIRDLYNRNGLDQPLIGVDQEGGKVQRFKNGFIDFPSFYSLGQKFKKDASLGYVYDLALEKGRMLKGLGIDINFSPVLDVARNRNNPIIHQLERSFSENERIVSLLSVVYSRGLMDSGIIPCGKHFPGHGGTDKDSHLELPVVLDYPEKMFCDLVPFSSFISKGFNMLMSSHVLYPSIDPDRPATLSQTINKGLLRKGLGFKGVLVSDDLCMKALYSNKIKEKFDINDLFLEALNAGNDMVLVCHEEYAKKLNLKMLQKKSKGKFRDSKLRIDFLKSLT